MATVGLRELRQDASDLVRRVENGEHIDITVSGRPAARLVPPDPPQWRSFAEVAGIFDGRPDPDWATDRDRVGHEPADPWAERP